MNPRLAAVLLAAGRGRRLGFPKASLELRGRWMLPHLVVALRAVAEEVVLVLSPEAADSIAGRPAPGADQTVLNPDPDAGRTGSLLCGLAAITAATDGVLVHPCDVPLLSADATRKLVQAWAARDDRQHLLARPVTPAGRGGHPLLVGAERLPKLRAFAPERPLRDLLDEDRDSVLNVPLTADPGPFLDVNTAEQLALLENLLEQSSGSEPDPNDPGRE